MTDNGRAAMHEGGPAALEPTTDVVTDAVCPRCGYDPAGLDTREARAAIAKPRHSVSESYDENRPFTAAQDRVTFHLPRYDRWIVLRQLHGASHASFEALRAHAAATRALLGADDWSYLAVLGVREYEINDPESFEATRSVLETLRKFIAAIAVDTSGKSQPDPGSLSIGSNAYRLELLVRKIDYVLAGDGI